jgi:hypothetical protein
MLATLLQENAQEPAPLGEAEIGNIARSIAKKPPGAPEAPPSRRPVRVAEVLSRPRAAQLSWLLEHFRITRGRPTLLLGPSEAGKTWLLQELALSVAAGLPVCWGGLALTMRGRVVHVDYEQGEEHTAYRYARLAFGLGVDLASIPLELIAEPVKHLDDPGAADDFREFMEGTALLVIDSLRAATPRSKENDSESRAVLDMLRQLSDQTGCVVVVIHHEAKPHPGQAQIYRARGTSGFVDAAGAIIAVSMAAPYRSLRQTKAAAGPHGADHAVLLQDLGSASTVDGLSEGLAIVTKTAATATARTTAEGAARDRVVDYVRDHPRCKKTDALKNVHGDNNVVRVALRNLVSEGRIVVHHEGRAHLLQLDDQEGSQAPSLAGPAEDNLSQAGSGAGCCPPMLAERLRPVRAAPASGSTQTISKITRPPVSKVNRLCLAPAPHWQRTAQPAGCPPWPGSPPAGPTVLRARSSAPKREAKEAGLARCRSIAPRSSLTRSLRPGGSSAKSPISGLHWPSWRRSFSPGGSQRETRMRPWAC